MTDDPSLPATGAKSAAKASTPSTGDDTPTSDYSPATSTEQTKRGFPLLGLVSLLLVLLSIAYYQYRLEFLVIENSALQNKQSQLEGQLTKQLEQNAAQQVLMEKAAEARALLDAKLFALNEQIQQLPGARAEDWKLAEVEYLLRLANQRVQLQHELAGAEALLKAADTILAELDDPTLIQVRELLAQERLALADANKLDRQGLYLKLQALKTRIKESVLPPQHFSEERPLREDEALTFNGTASEDANSEQDGANVKPSLWQQLLNLVQVRHRDEAFDAPLRQSQYQLLEHSLLLMIEQAQWALLKQEQSLYQESLNNAVEWIDGKLRHSAAQSLLGELQVLANEDVRQSLPDISGSLRQLRSVIQARTYRPVVPETDTENDAKPEAKPQSKTQPASASLGATV